MELVKRAAVPQVELRTERVTVESLGGDVLVRGRVLAHGMQLAALLDRLSVPEPGETADEARERAGAVYAAHALAKQVLAADEKPLFTVEQWSIWGGTHGADFVRLFDVAESLSGAKSEAVAKN